MNVFEYTIPATVQQPAGNASSITYEFKSTKTNSDSWRWADSNADSGWTTSSERGGTWGGTTHSTEWTDCYGNKGTSCIVAETESSSSSIGRSYAGSPSNSNGSQHNRNYGATDVSYISYTKQGGNSSTSEAGADAVDGVNTPFNNGDGDAWESTVSFSYHKAEKANSAYIHGVVGLSTKTYRSSNSGEEGWPTAIPPSYVCGSSYTRTALTFTNGWLQETVSSFTFTKSTTTSTASGSGTNTWTTTKETTTTRNSSWSYYPDGATYCTSGGGTKSRTDNVNYIGEAAGTSSALGSSNQTVKVVSGDGGSSFLVAAEHEPQTLAELKDPRTFLNLTDQLTYGVTSSTKLGTIYTVADNDAFALLSYEVPAWTYESTSSSGGTRESSYTLGGWGRVPASTAAYTRAEHTRSTWLTTLTSEASYSGIGATTATREATSMAWSDNINPVTYSQTDVLPVSTTSNILTATESNEGRGSTTSRGFSVTDCTTFLPNAFSRDLDRDLSIVVSEQLDHGANAPASSINTARMYISGNIGTTLTVETMASISNGILALIPWPTTSWTSGSSSWGMSINGRSLSWGKTEAFTKSSNPSDPSTLSTTSASSSGLLSDAGTNGGTKTGNVFSSVINGKMTATFGFGLWAALKTNSTGGTVEALSFSNKSQGVTTTLASPEYFSFAGAVQDTGLAWEETPNYISVEVEEL
jgi:hypothetical protein